MKRLLAWFGWMLLISPSPSPALAVEGQGGLRLHNTLMDHMVVQRDRPIVLHGWAEPGAQVWATLDEDRAQTLAGEDGHWRVTLPARPAGGAISIDIGSGDDTITLQDVLVGDVWLLGGQSNMRSRMIDSQETRDWLQAVGPQDRVRLIEIEFNDTPEPVDEPILREPAGWSTMTAERAIRFSAVGLVFGVELHQSLDVPIGLIHASRGGTPIESWLTAENLEAELGTHQPELGRWPASEYYHGMIAPLLDTPLAGIAWYQGESNAQRPDTYAGLFRRLIHQWRSDFESPELPFLFVQLPSYGTDPRDPTGQSWAWLREAQAAALQLPHTAMAVTLDAGMYDDIHPLRKIVIGERLAAAALAMHRGEPDSAPRMERVAFVDSVAVIHLDSVTSSMEARRVEMREGKQRARPVGARYIAEAGVPHGFTIAGIDRVFHPAEATIDGQTIRVRSAAVLEPVAVRYGWSNFTLANIYDADGRPLPPFRSDAWPRTPPAQP